MAKAQNDALASLDDEYSHLCKSCQKVLNWFVNGTSSDENIDSFGPIPKNSLLSGEEQGCIFCVQILRGPAYWSRSLFEYKRCGHLLAVDGMTFMIEKDISVARGPLSTQKIRKSSISVDLGPSTSSDGALSIAKDWLQQCESHISCQRYADANRRAFIPTRLVFIGEGKIHLSSSADILDGSEYTTLSHCWGNYMPTRLLQENISEFYRGIGYAELSKTFQDAIQVTRRLGKEYLWIDSLCIIQDSLEDWQREAGLMKDVYANGYCNISATYAKDSSYGLFSDRNPLALKSRIQIPREPCGAPQSFRLMNLALWLLDINRAPLNERAWTMQERLLSRRNLHFGRGQLYWECFEITACEAFPDFLPSQMMGYMTRKSSFLEILNPYITDDEHLSLLSQRALKQWKAFVQEYSYRSLTQSSDRLVAISGLAELFSTAILPSQSSSGARPQYLAGLWDGDVAPQLLWLLFEPCQMDSHITEYIAPSWSWASMNNHIFYCSDVRYWAVSQFSSSVTLLNLREPFGQVTAGTLSLLGKLARTTYYSENRTLSIDVASGSIILEGLDLRWDYWPRCDGEFFLLPVSSLQDRDKNSDIWAHTNKQDGIETKIKIAVSEWRGLILQSTDTLRNSFSPGMKPKWRRVGFFETTRSQSTTQVLAIMRGIKYQDDLAGEMMETCVEVEVLGLGNKAHRIDLV